MVHRKDLAIRDLPLREDILRRVLAVGVKTMGEFSRLEEDTLPQFVFDEVWDSLELYGLARRHGDLSLSQLSVASDVSSWVRQAKVRTVRELVFREPGTVPKTVIEAFEGALDDRALSQSRDWFAVTPMRAQPLRTVVARAYEVFAPYQPLRGPLRYCDCPSCMVPENAALLVNTPLRSIHANLLAEYTDSAHGYDSQVVEPQLKYFLPRYFELLANCDPPSFLTSSRCLARLGDARYREHWPATEASVVSAFFDAFLTAMVSHADVDVLVDALTLLSLGGEEVHAVLEVLWRAPDPPAILQMAALSLLSEAPSFMEPDDYAALKTWLAQKRVQERMMSNLPVVEGRSKVLLEDALTLPWTS